MKINILQWMICVTVAIILFAIEDVLQFFTYILMMCLRGNEWMIKWLNNYIERCTK